MPKHTQKGYILVLSLMILALVLIISTQVFNSGTLYTLVVQTTVNRQKAKRIALGGVQVAMSQLFTATGGQPGEEQKKLLATVFPMINRWQTYELQQNVEGIDGVLRICIMSEQGKFNLNSFYDFSKKKFIGEDRPDGGMRTLAENIFKAAREYVGKDLFPAFEKLLKERGYPFNDVTELFNSPSFASFKHLVFYEPPITATKKAKRPIYLTDLFTVSSASSSLDPWLLSDSSCAVLGLARAQTGDIKKRSEEIKNVVKNITQKMNWHRDWDILLKQFYDKDFARLPQNLSSLLQTQFEPRTFSVLSYGKVDSVEQRMLVIIERSTQKRSWPSQFIIKKMYWI